MELRKVFKIKKDGEVQVKLSHLKRGDIFRMEPVDETDTQIDPKEHLVAASNGYLDQREDGTVVGTIEVEEKN